MILLLSSLHALRRIAGIGVVLFLLSAVPSPCVAQYGLVLWRSGEEYQLGNGQFGLSPTPTFTFELLENNPNTIDASFLKPGSTESVPLTHITSSWSGYSATFNSRSALMATFPLGEYAVSIRVPASFHSLRIDDSLDVLPTTPYFTNDTYNRLQNLDTRVPALLSFTSMIANPAFLSQFKGVQVMDLTTGSALSIPSLYSLPLDQTQAILPANTFTPSHRYSMVIASENRIGLGKENDYSRSTVGTVQTYLTFTASPIPEMSTFNLSILGLTILVFWTQLSGTGTIRTVPRRDEV